MAGRQNHVLSKLHWGSLGAALLGTQSTPSTTKGAMPSKVQRRSPSRKTENEPRIPTPHTHTHTHTHTRPVPLGRMDLSLCLRVNLRLPVLHIQYSANSFMLRAASRRIASLLGVRRDAGRGRLISSSALSNFRSLRRL